MFISDLPAVIRHLLHLATGAGESGVCACLARLLVHHCQSIPLLRCTVSPWHQKCKNIYCNDRSRENIYCNDRGSGFITLTEPGIRSKTLFHFSLVFTQSCMVLTLGALNLCCASWAYRQRLNVTRAGAVS